MLSIEEFKDLEVGDQIEGPALFKVLTDEPVVMLTALKTKTRAEFVASFDGVTLGRWVCILSNGELQWQT
ncbi:hypothetical protein [Hyphomicrobium sp. ghe19]|uniref:hypothetical protein n=1 Tax=Hyphomicrobium sp. ghe19 TaxID=2682968 RepID=UPI001366B751|nr:hypothetical protein HYPP_02515 [Hyphomicrobium sp. ghe19]